MTQQINVSDVLREITKELNQPIKIMIGTPCYGGMITVDYMTSLLRTKSLFRDAGIELEVAFLSNESLIPRGRNTIVAKFLANTSCTHLLFIDADITWQPQDIIRLLISRKNLVGGCYPKKRYNFEKLQDILPMLQSHADHFHNGVISKDLLLAKITDYVMNFGGVPTIEGNLISLKHIGTGFMLISRTCLNQFKEKYPYLKYNDDHGVLSPAEDAELYAFFDTDIAEKHYLSEDYLFCKRWDDISSEKIWIDITIKLSHTGPHKFDGNYHLSIMDIKKTIEDAIQKKKELTQTPKDSELVTQTQTESLALKIKNEPESDSD